MSFWKNAKDKSVIDRLVDERIHALAVQEIGAGVRRDGLWAKAILETGTNDRLAKLAYLKLLVQHLKDEYYVDSRQQEMAKEESQTSALERELAKQHRREQEKRAAHARKKKRTEKKSRSAKLKKHTRRATRAPNKKSLMQIWRK